LGNKVVIGKSKFISKISTKTSQETFNIQLFLKNGKLLKASYVVNWHSGQPMTAKLTFYGGVNEIGGNKILLQTEDGSVLLDFGRRWANITSSSQNSLLSVPRMPCEICFGWESCQRLMASIRLTRLT
jgi:predicted metal-dependent RNase